MTPHFSTTAPLLTEDWKRRLNALKHLQALVLGSSDVPWLLQQKYGQKDERIKILSWINLHYLCLHLSSSQGQLPKKVDLFYLWVAATAFIWPGEE